MDGRMGQVYLILWCSIMWRMQTKEYIVEIFVETTSMKFQTFPDCIVALWSLSLTHSLLFPNKQIKKKNYGKLEIMFKFFSTLIWLLSCSVRLILCATVCWGDKRLFIQTHTGAIKELNEHPKSYITAASANTVETLCPSWRHWGGKC